MSEEKKEESEEEPYTVDENGQLHCKWPGCTSIFQGDVPGMKAFAAHYGAHKKRGIKPPEQTAKGLSPQELAAIIDLRKRNEEAAKTAALKTIDQILADRDQLFDVYVPILNCKIKYGRLLVKEINEATAKPDEESFLRKIVYLMWHKGDPSVTEEKINDLEIEELRLIFHSIWENTPFLFQTRTGMQESSSPQRSKEPP